MTGAQGGMIGWLRRCGRYGCTRSGPVGVAPAGGENSPRSTLSASTCVETTKASDMPISVRSMTRRFMRKGSLRVPETLALLRARGNGWRNTQSWLEKHFDLRITRGLSLFLPGQIANPW